VTNRGDITFDLLHTRSIINICSEMQKVFRPYPLYLQQLSPQPCVGSTHAMHMHSDCRRPRLACKVVAVIEVMGVACA